MPPWLGYGRAQSHVTAFSRGLARLSAPTGETAQVCLVWLPETQPPLDARDLSSRRRILHLSN